jgi:hypothetical protein
MKTTSMQRPSSAHRFAELRNFLGDIDVANISKGLASGFGPELVHYSSRWQNRLLNGDQMLCEPGAFERVESCPFCGAPMYDPEGTQLIHNACECAKTDRSDE